MKKTEIVLGETYLGSVFYGTVRNYHKTWIKVLAKHPVQGWVAWDMRDGRQLHLLTSRPLIMTQAAAIAKGLGFAKGAQPQVARHAY